MIIGRDGGEYFHELLLVARITRDTAPPVLLSQAAASEHYRTRMNDA
jgi:hypothetical protein